MTKKLTPFHSVFTGEPEVVTHHATPRLVVSETMTINIYPVLTFVQLAALTWIPPPRGEVLTSICPSSSRQRSPRR